MKDINALLWGRGGDQSRESGSAESNFFCDADIENNKIFDEFHKKYLHPNDAFFRENFRKNCYMLKAVGYDECVLDFIPVADKEYCMVDRGTRVFCGTFTAKPYVEDNNIEKSIFSVLIADEWDIRKVMPIILEKRWHYVYFVLNQQAEKFASFLKLEDFLATLPPNVKFFATTEEMRQYFLDDHSAYLPRRILASEPGKYEELFKEIHTARIQSGIPSANVFLSICIPTYNRGAFALRAVKNSLLTDYDAEIEIFVSDNGSTVEKEEYAEIANMQDSRLHYYRAEENGGYSANIISCLKRATGRFAYFFSDEDLLVPENVGMALEWMIHYTPNMGGCFFGFADSGDCMEEKVFNAGVDAVAIAYHNGYATGMCLNLDHAKTLNLAVQLEEYKETELFRLYPQCLSLMLIALQFDVVQSPINLWKFGKEPGRDLDWPLDESGRLIGETPEHRILQIQEATKFVAEHLSKDDLEKFILGCIPLYFLRLSYLFKGGDRFLKERYGWTYIWSLYYRYCLQTLQDYKEKFDDIPSVISKMDKIFLEWLICKREQRISTPEENLRSSLCAQIAKYYYEKGTPIQDIDFAQIEGELEGWVQDFFAERT